MQAPARGPTLRQYRLPCRAIRPTQREPMSQQAMEAAIAEILGGVKDVKADLQTAKVDLQAGLQHLDTKLDAQSQQVNKRLVELSAAQAQQHLQQQQFVAEQQAQRTEVAQQQQRIEHLTQEVHRLGRGMYLQNLLHKWDSETAADAHRQARAAECLKVTKPRGVQQPLTREKTAAELGVALEVVERPQGKGREGCFLARVGVPGVKAKLDELRQARGGEWPVTLGGLLVSRERTALGQQRWECMKQLKPIIRRILAAEEAWDTFDVFEGPSAQELWISAGPA